MRILRSFQCALRGIKYCINNERNMRIHFVVAVYVMIFSYFFELSKSQLIVLVMAILSVITTEMINAAIEGLSDIFVSEYSVAAKNVKDVAAGAVFISVAGAVAVGLILFSDINAYLRIFDFFCSYPISIVVLGILSAASLFYIYFGSLAIINKIKILFKL